MQTDLPFADALAIVRAAASPLAPETIPIRRGLGRTLAREVRAADASPPFDASAMDGYAVRVAGLSELPARLPVVETVAAGREARLFVLPGTCVQIFTGAPVPDGADAVVPREWTQRTDDGAVLVRRAPEAGQYIRRAGSALAEGEVLLSAGAVLTPPAVGALAAAGRSEVPVRRTPHVALIVTGDELVEPGASLRPGQIRDINGPGLGAQVVAAGGALRHRLHAADVEHDLIEALDIASDSDLIVVVGGVSVGERDLVKPTFAERGVEWDFWKVRQRPGRPLTFGTLAVGTRRVPVLGLPGNPVSAAVGFELYGRALLDRMLGREPADAFETGTLTEAVPKAGGLDTFIRVRASRSADGALLLTPTGPQGSHVYRSVVDGSGLAHLPAAWDAADEGAEAEYRPFPWSDAAPVGRA